MRRGGFGLAGLALLALAGAMPAHAAELFRLDQRFGSIGFSVSNLGLFRAHGDFGRFTGTLRIDPAAPDATDIAVTVAARSVHSGWAQETAMLRSADFFDVARYPAIRFHSRAVRADGVHRYLIQGNLTLRGQTRPVVLHAHLVRAARNAAGQQIDDFVVTGAVSRRAFGMTADPLFIADKVRLVIHARVILGSGPGG
ncbi:MAG: YceI family protein [Acetobacteraceae bacterium]